MLSLLGRSKIFVHQIHEIAEFLGFETRNKYEILDEQKNRIGYAAEQRKGFLNFLFRQFLGHWRRFDVHFFTNDRQLFMIGSHPFRWFFERIEIRTADGVYLGAIQKRFSFITKRFDVENERGFAFMSVASPLWRLWTFTFLLRGIKRAEIKKTWAGVLAEAFTDKDNFLVEYTDPSLTENERKILLAAAVFIDLLYFEKKAGRDRSPVDLLQ